jgi:hypothetical protein
VRYLSLGEVLELHRRIIEQTGGAGGLRDLGALESALAQPAATFDAQGAVSFHMRLTKQGILSDPWPGEETDESADRPQNSLALLRHWHSTLMRIDEDYTFGDLVSLLRNVDDIENLSPMVGCDVAAVLADTDRSWNRDDEEPIQYLQVSNVAELTKYEEDLAHPDEPLRWMDGDEATEQDRLDAGIAMLTGAPKPMRVVDATGDDPITGEPSLRRLHVPRIHGRWIPPYDLRREFEGWGRWEEPYRGYFSQHPEIDPERYEGAFALDFIALSAILHLPLRYRPKVQFWSGPFRGAGELLFETELTITFGEFLRAIFWEIGFHGSPAERDAAFESLRERIEAVDRRKHQDKRGG